MGDSGSSRETTSPPEVRTPLRTLSIFWTGTWPDIWLDVSSQHLGLDLFSLLLRLSPGGRASHRARSSWIGSLKVSTSTSVPSRAEPSNVDSNVQSFFVYLFSFGLISTYSINIK